MSRLLSILLLLTAAPTLAQKPPELGYVFPPVVQAGSTTDVQLGGYDFTPDMQFFVHDRRIKLDVGGPPGKFLVPEPPYWFGLKGHSPAMPIPREVPARIEIPADVPAGLAHRQVANANGSSATAVFYVSDGPETVEDRDRDHVQELPSLPIAVSGRIGKIAEVDRYRLIAQMDGPVTIELFARRLGANMNGVIEVRDDSGRIVADAADTEGLDTSVTFAAQADAPYVISLYDVDFRGNRAYVYRLALTQGPRVISTIPAVGRRGETREVECVGIGVATGGAKLESVRRQLSFPADPRQIAMRYRLETPFGVAPAIEIPLSDLPTTTESANSEAKPQAIDVPGILTGVLGGPSEEDVYVWSAKKDEVWHITLASRAIGSDLDMSLSVRDSEGKQVAFNDDLPGTPDAGLDFAVPADGNYTCVVTDFSGRITIGAAVYRLTLQRRQPAFALSVPQQINLAIGGTAEIPVSVTRHGGFTDEIPVHITGLTAGVTVPDELKVPSEGNELKIPLTAAGDAASQAALIQIAGTAKIGETMITCQAMAPAVGNLCPRDPSANRSPWVIVATTLKPPFAVELVDKNRQRAVHRGTTYPAEFLIKRDDGFDGEVLLQMAAKQARHRQGMRGPVIRVPPGVDRAVYPCFLPEWLETDRTSRMDVLGVAKVLDPQGQQRYVTRAANARVTMILEGALLKVSHRTPELTVRPGGSFEIPVEVLRSAKLAASAEIELVIPEELAGVVKCDSVTLPIEQTRTVLHVETLFHPKLTGKWQFDVVATALQDGKWPAVSQTEIAVEFAETP